jgi:hypothetical protein
MRVHLRFLRKGEITQKALQKDGWQLEPEPDGSVTAGHALVPDEPAARNRLQGLGLLTTTAVAIEFIGAPMGRSSYRS